MTTAGFGPPFALGRGRGSSARVPLTRGIGSGEPANHKVRYHGAVPVCGVLGDTELFNYFGAYQTAAQQLAGYPVTAWPAANWAQIAPAALRPSVAQAFPCAPG